MAGQRPLHARGRARPLPRPAGARTPARRHPPGRPRQAPAGGGLGRVGAAPRAGALTGQALQGRAVLRGPGAERPPLPDHRGTAPQRLRAGQRRPAARGLLAAARRAGKPGRAALAADLAAAARRAAVPALRARHPVRGGRRAGAMSTVASAGAAATPAPAPDFELPAALLAAEPPEARGLSRGGVRLMVSRGRAWPVPAEFRELPGHLRPEGVATDWPLEVYQSCFAREPGSTAMASAGRAFTPELLTALVSSGIVVAPLLLHTCGLTGEDGGPPPERCVRVVDGLLTGWHEPGGSHLRLLEAVAGLEPLGLAYRAALEHGFAWGTFGDLHLILPGSRRRARR